MPLPAPEEPKLSLPGFAWASFTRSATVFAGESARTTRMMLVRMVGTMCCRSLPTSMPSL
jgi:hypothetical protein